MAILIFIKEKKEQEAIYMLLYNMFKHTFSTITTRIYTNFTASYGIKVAR